MSAPKANIEAWKAGRCMVCGGERSELQAYSCQRCLFAGREHPEGSEERCAAADAWWSMADECDHAAAKSEAQMCPHCERGMADPRHSDMWCPHCGGTGQAEAAYE